MLKFVWVTAQTGTVTSRCDEYVSRYLFILFFLGIGQLKLATEQENERAAEIETLRQEKDDLAVKLNFTENILKV